jgi:hypothetical protein
MAAMDSSSVLVIGVNACATAVLVTAGMTKLVSPDQLRLALADVLGDLGRWVTKSRLKVFAVIEMIAGVSLSVPVIQLPGAWAVGVLGVCFAIAGVLGLLRRSTTACGCFGRSAGRPLGLVNVLVGAAFLAVLVVDHAATTSDAGPYFYGSAVGASLATVLLTLWAHRQLIKEFTRPREASAPR